VQACKHRNSTDARGHPPGPSWPVLPREIEPHGGAARPALRILLRRSEKEGQEFSIDTQREGALRFADGLRRREPLIFWEEIHDYIEDGIAGDDFAGRAALHRLLTEVASGDVVICRDHFRLGRDAIDSAVTVRELVRDRRARLFYYSSGQEVAFHSAIDAAMTFIQGVGAQMELEAIRSRTREALRQRVRSGRVAGGACPATRLEDVLASNRLPSEA
jgi:DNA invertase Pin-like site-specific DNA recombinase